MQFRIDAILPLSDRTNLLLAQPTRVHRNRLPLLRLLALCKAWETTAVAQPRCSFPPYSDICHPRKTTKSCRMGHDTQNRLRWKTDDHQDQRVHCESGPCKTGLL